MHLHKTVKWDIIDQCNLRCTHCSVADRYFTGSAQTGCATAAGRRRIVEALIGGGIKHISILGGEPMLLGEELFDILGLFKSHGISISLVTNGLLINEAARNKIVQLRPDRLVFSMEGPEAASHDLMRGKGNFTKLVEIIGGIKAAIANAGDGASAGISININTVVTRRNMNSVAEMIPFVRSLGADELSLLGLNCVGNAAKAQDQLMLSIGDELAVARKVADMYGQGDNREKLKLNVNFIYPVVRDYLLVHENRVLPFPQICCSAASSLAYVTPWGGMHPCDRIFINNYDQHFRSPKDGIEDYRLDRAGFYDVWNSRYFLNTFDFVNDQASYTSYDPCLRCSYFVQKKCNPCPLDAMGLKRFPMEACLNVEKMSGAAINQLIERAKALDSARSALNGESSRPAEKVAGPMSDNRAISPPYPVDRKQSVTPQKGVRVAYLHGKKAYMMIHPISGETLFLDANGHIAWQLLNGQPQQTVEEICESYYRQLATEYSPVSLPEIKRKIVDNVASLIGILVAKQFLVLG